jgi:hypothetical protein
MASDVYRKNKKPGWSRYPGIVFVNDRLCLFLTLCLPIRITQFFQVAFQPKQTVTELVALRRHRLFPYFTLGHGFTPFPLHVCLIPVLR